MRCSSGFANGSVMTCRGRRSPAGVLPRCAGPRRKSAFGSLLPWPRSPIGTPPAPMSYSSAFGHPPLGGPNVRLGARSVAHGSWPHRRCVPGVSGRKELAPSRSGAYSPGLVPESVRSVPCGFRRCWHASRPHRPASGWVPSASRSLAHQRRYTQPAPSRDRGCSRGSQRSNVARHGCRVGRGEDVAPFRLVGLT